MAAHPAPWAVAVSGGGDSAALMHLAAAYAKANKLPLPVVLTVDHGLRPGSAKASKQVVSWAKQAGLKAQLLTWRGKKPKSGIEAAAREARYRLMGAWLGKNKITTLLVGHNQDDQAETFLLRLARGSGLDGLAGMRMRAPWPLPDFAALVVARPLLNLRRDDLRAYLKARGLAWLEDPMNDDTAFDRVKMRNARTVLSEVGITPSRIAAAAAHLARARESLEIATEAVLQRAVRVDKAHPDQKRVLVDSGALAAAPRELGLRSLASILMVVGRQPYRPRFVSLERIFDQIAGGGLGGGATLHGCRIRPLSSKAKDFVSFDLAVEPESPRKTGGSATRRNR
ncbi:MAG TPA: tRNA lysidine(34) synthetase TilS [Rhizomicrobium sp.]|nr:tRNA lysidine(34) synthetase TilS [Rhizomicrobium sp.]